MYSFELQTRTIVTVFVTTVALVTVSVVRYMWGEPGRVEHLFLGSGVLVVAGASLWAWETSYRGGIRSLIGAVFVLFAYIGLIPDLVRWLSGEPVVASITADLLKFVGAVGLVLLGSGFLLHRQVRGESRQREQQRWTRLAAEAMEESASTRESGSAREAPPRPSSPPGAMDAATPRGDDPTGELGAIPFTGTAGGLPPEFELRMGLSPVRRISMVAVVGLLCMPAVLISIALGESMGGGFGRWAQEFTQSFLSAENSRGSWMPPLLPLMIAMAPPMAMMALARYRSSLSVTRDGIEGFVSRAAVAGRPEFATGRIHIPWQEIRSVSLHLPPADDPLERRQRFGGHLVISTPTGAHVFLPHLWVLPGGADHRLTLTRGIPRTRSALTTHMRHSPLVRALESRGQSVEVTDSETPGSRALDLDVMARHRGLTALGVIIMLAAIFTGLNWDPEQSRNAVSVIPLMLAAVVGGCGLTAWLSRGAPFSERMALSVLALIALAYAAYCAAPTLDRGLQSLQPAIQAWFTPG
jgi:hypothetical protein